MRNIIKIVIKGFSGYCELNEAFHDKVTITSNSIQYEYTPKLESDINPVRKWKYTTTSPIFSKQYSTIVSMLDKVMEIDELDICKDIGSTEFILTFEDNTKWKKTFFVLDPVFEEVFHEIKVLVPSCEYTPAILLTEEDFV